MTKSKWPPDYWSDPRVIAVAEAIYDAEGIGPDSFPRDKAVQYWPGVEARRFVRLFDALSQGTPRP